MRSGMAGAAWTALKSLPVHAVGTATAEAARDAGWRVETVGTGDIAELACRFAGVASTFASGRRGSARGPDGSPDRTRIVYRSGPIRNARLAIARRAWLPPFIARGQVDAWPSLLTNRHCTAIARYQLGGSGGLRSGLGAHRGCRSTQRRKPAGTRRHAVPHIAPSMTASLPSPRLDLDRALRLGIVAAHRRRGAGDMGPVALGSWRALPRGRAAPAAAGCPPGAATSRTGSSDEPLTAADAARIASIESRLGAIETQAQAAAGSAGRADAMLVAFAARRAIDRGVALGYLEPLLVQRFGAAHQAAVATIVTASRDPVRLDSLVAEYEALAIILRGGGPEEGWWDAFRRELGTIVSVHRADTPSPQPQARLRPGAGPARGRRGRCGAGRDDASARRRQRRSMDRSGPPLHRGAPRARRNRIRRRCSARPSLPIPPASAA